MQPLFTVPIPQDEASERSIRLYTALKKLVAQEGWDFYTIQSFPGLGDDYSTTWFAQSMILNDGIGTSTLSDFNTAMTVKLLTELSELPVYYGDLQHIDKATREIKIIGDGACPPGLAGALEPASFAQHGIPTEGAAGGLSVQLTCRPGEGVLARLGRDRGEFEVVITVIESWKTFLQTQGAVIDNATVLNYGDAAAERAAAADGTIVADLSQLGVIAFRGDEAATFLQNQLTNDVRSLHADAAQWNGYCSPKGRLLGNFLLWRQGEDYCLQLSGDILPGVLKRLSMFILRTKVQGRDASDESVRLVVAGK